MTNEEALRPKRRRRAELEQIVIEAGLDLLMAEGIGIGADRVSYADVFRRVEEKHGFRITQASVHGRIWESQRDFQLALLERAAEFDASDRLRETADAASAVLAEADVSTLVGRRRALRELCRTAGLANVEVIKRSSDWKLRKSVETGFAFTQSDDYRKLGELLAKSRNEVDQRYAEMIEFLLGRVRCRPKPGYRHLESPVRHVVLLIAASLEGMHVRATAEDMGELALPTGADGMTQVWHPHAVSIWHAISAVFELDGELDPCDRALDLLELPVS